MNTLPQAPEDPVQVLAADDGEDHNHILDDPMDCSVVSDPEPEGGHLEANQSPALGGPGKGFRRRPEVRGGFSSGDREEVWQAGSGRA